MFFELIRNWRWSPLHDTVLNWNMNKILFTTFYFTQRAIKSNGNILFVNEIWTAVSKIQLYMSLYLNNMLIGVCILLFRNKIFAKTRDVLEPYMNNHWSVPFRLSFLCGSETQGHCQHRTLFNKFLLLPTSMYQGSTLQIFKKKQQ
jgi:hypothetical protein